VAKAFIKLGLKPHHSVGILGFNSPEWFLADLGAVFAGGIATGIYPTNSQEACKYIAENCRANVFVVEDEKQLEKILAVRDQLPGNGNQLNQRTHSSPPPQMETIAKK
jgi:long-chain-fatty-acid--CoA ligase ACSBG